MKLRHIRIQNFRGIKDLELDLDDLVVLIGENNSGKTAILHALELCLRKLGPRSRMVFSPFDFHLEDENAAPRSAEAISITITFAEDEVGDWSDARIRRLKEISYVDAKTERSAVTLQVGWAYNAAERDFKQTWSFLDEKGQPRNSKSTHLDVLRGERGEIAFHLLDALRDAGRNFDVNGPFWRPFLKEGQLAEDMKAEIEAKLKEANDLVVGNHESFGKVSQELAKVQQLVPMQSGEVVSIEAVPGRIFDMLAKAQVHLGTATGAKVPVGRHGEGTQSLAVLLLFAAFLDLDKSGALKERSTIVALEEPEAHLHPSAVRTLWKTLDGIPGQKLISTHSGDLLSQVPVAAIRRLVRGPTGVKSHRLKPGTLNAHEQRMFNFHIRHGRGELLFARCWLLGEGETEVTLFREIAPHLGIDLERIGVRCIPYRLGANLELFLKVANDLGIRWCVLTDNDVQGKRDQKVASKYADKAELPELLYELPQSDMELFLCSEGFGAIYEEILEGQSENNLQEFPRRNDYSEILGALKKHRDRKGYKTEAALKVAHEIAKKRKPAPLILEAVIRKAAELAEGA